MPSKQQVVIIGNGMVGHRFVELLQNENNGLYDIIVFAEEPHIAYDRVQLSSYFKDFSADHLALTTVQQYKDFGVTLCLKESITQINPTHSTITTESGKTFHYDKLIIATGSYPFVPPIPGNEQPHCHVYRTINDLETITKSAENSTHGVVIGGGLLGLEAANALYQLGLETHVIEFSPRLMAVQLDAASGDLLKRKIENLNINVHTNHNTQAITLGEKHRYRMEFTDHEHLETDLIVFSAGIRPRDELARKAGICIGERGGIVINEYCQTSIDNIYAIGECALWKGKIFGLVAPGYQMAQVAVQHIMGNQNSFNGSDMSTKLKLLGVDVASIGDAHAKTKNAQCYVYANDIEEIYKKVIVNEQGNKVVGAILVGDTSDYSILQQLYINNTELSDPPESLILPQCSGATKSLGIDALPDQAQICTCFSISKSDICQAIENGCTTVAKIKSETCATSGCGGCASTVKQILAVELERLGLEVTNHICEHFAYSRQELFDIIRMKQIKTFNELLSKHGTGHGCDICKPTIGSMLASYWNEYILENEHISLQDTNDLFLANMQKDGTYSVVPRVPGGEITPDKLIKIGQIAKQFDLYTKITGGQRIDLFGAKVHQLPIIWQQLIDAGFETGHAYGKAVRTVKSCVGSTWCRYGVQDSVSMAIQLELRYRGIRSPHKIKMAVSGCTRECAEAQSKDIGVIATETGWNLYVAGNGGMRPRHADLLATNINDEILIKYIDRFIMFYIRTADRLQRTSVWLENLSGGLSYLTSVIIEDKLGIVTQLESEMEHLVTSYQCEWKKTLSDPSKLKRFKHFINTSKSDDNLKYIRERGQRIPIDNSTDYKVPLKEISEKQLVVNS